MRKFLMVALVVGSSAVIAEEDLLTITLELQDVVAYKALESINEICGSRIEPAQLLNPNHKISFNFQSLPCTTAIKLLLNFNKADS